VTQFTVKTHDLDARSLLRVLRELVTSLEQLSMATAR
jgi:hypothetical protein